LIHFYKRDVGKPEQVKRKHLQFLLLVQRKECFDDGWE